MDSLLQGDGDADLERHYLAKHVALLAGIHPQVSDQCQLFRRK